MGGGGAPGEGGVAGAGGKLGQHATSAPGRPDATEHSAARCHSDRESGKEEEALTGEMSNEFSNPVTTLSVWWPPWRAKKPEEEWDRSFSPGPRPLR